MCLGIPGQLKEISEVEPAPGEGRRLRRDEGRQHRPARGRAALEPGDWVLIHVGFAMSKIDEEEAALALASLQLMGQAYDDELERSGSRRSRVSHEHERDGRMRWE